ncbi:MAG TPA: folate family ECF transporter S component [Candidatus Xenobia bacterium]
MKKPIRYYTQAAVLVALCIVVRRFMAPQHMGGLNLGGLPIVLAGFTLGPAGGALVGGVSDIVGVLLVPASSHGYSFLFTITAALTGAIPPGVLMLFKKHEQEQWWAIGCAVAVGMLITKVWLVPCFMNLVYGTSVSAEVIRAIMTQAWHIPLYVFLTVPILKAYRTTTRLKEATA